MTRARALLPLVIAAALLGSPHPALSATAKAGGTCTKAGATTKVSGKTLVCTKSGKKLVWVAKKTSAAPQPTPSATPTPTPTATAINPIWAKTGWKQPTSASVVSDAAVAAFGSWAATTRSTIALTFRLQDGTPDALATWIKDGVGFLAPRLPAFPMPKAYVAIAAKDATYYTSIMTELYGKQVADQERGAFGNAPAAAGGFNNVWNLTTIANDDLMNRDRIGMQQTPAHEYFHLLQNNITGCGPCNNTPREVPQWFWEGPATFMGVQSLAYLKWSTYDSARSTFIQRANNSAPTRSLRLRDVKINDGKVDPYGVGMVASEFLVANVGVEKFINVFYEVGKGKTFAEAFVSATGVSLDDFYEMFEDARKTLGTPRY